MQDSSSLSNGRNNGYLIHEKDDVKMNDLSPFYNVMSYSF